MRILLASLFFILSGSVLAQVPDNYIKLDNIMDKDSLFIMLSDTLPTSQWHGRGNWTNMVSFINYLETVFDTIGGGGDDWGSDAVNHDGTLTGDGTVGNVLKVDTTEIATQHDLTLITSVTDHGALTGLSDDDHTQYPLLLGRAGSQTLNGGNAANEDLTLNGTSHATKTSSYVSLQPTGGSTSFGGGVSLATNTRFFYLGLGEDVGGVATITNTSAGIIASSVGALSGELRLGGTQAFTAARGVNFVVGNRNTSTGNSFIAGYYSARLSSAGARASTMVGGSFHASTDDATGGTVTELTALKSAIQTSTGVTTTSAYGFKIEDLINTGTQTNTYGIYIGDMTTGTQTNQAYGLYQVDTGARNYFGGNVGIGTTAPDKKLEVNLGTSDAFRLSYNDANGSAATFSDQTLSSVGLSTFDNTGSGPGFMFNDKTGVAAIGGVATTLTGRDASNYFTNVTVGSGLSLTAGSLTAPGDHDWYEFGTTSPPNAITDEKFTEGKLMIGTDDQPDATVHIKDNGPVELILEELGDVVEMTTKANSGGTTHPFQLTIQNKDSDIDGDYYTHSFIRADKASGTLPGGTLEFHMGYDSVNIDHVASIVSRESGGTNGLVHNRGGIRNDWDDDATAAVTMNSGQYGMVMTFNGAKTCTLPALSATLRGQVFFIYNNSPAGDITVTPAMIGDTLLGDLTISPGEYRHFEAATTGEYLGY